jgi:putative chitinase
MAGIDRDYFFKTIRLTLFRGAMTQSQVDGCNAILDSWDKDSSLADDRWLAYAFATAYHETAFTMQPINEYGGDAYFFKMYDKDGDRPEVAARLGNTEPGDGILFHGRGYVQLTGRANYTRMGQLLGIDLTSNASCADRALNPETASSIMEIGMRNGIFTGKKFADYFNAQTTDWINARRIINGLDRAEEIGAYGQSFMDAIRPAPTMASPSDGTGGLLRRLVSRLFKGGSARKT